MRATGSDPAFPDWDTIRQERARALAATLDLAALHHPLTRRKLAEAGLTRADLHGPDDLARLPLTTKAELAATPGDARLDLTDAAVPDEARTVWDIMYTTGSSGGPLPFVSTTSDFWDILLLQRRMLEIRGVTPADRIANLFPLTRQPHGAWIRVLHAAASMQVPVVSAMPGNSGAPVGQDIDGVLDTLLRTAPTILWGVPSYVRRVLAALAARGASLPSLRLLFVTGEGLSEEGRDELSARLAAIGAPEARISGSYGMTEMQGGLVECAAGSGFHNPLPEALLFDVVDPTTHQPLPEGEEGLLVLSHLRRRGTLLLRFAVGDTAVLSRAPCPHCGRVTERILGTPRRADDLVKIKGMLVSPARASAAVEGVGAVRDWRFELVKAADGPLAMDALRLLVAPEPGAPPDLPAQIAERVRAVIGVTPEVRLVTEADLAGGTWKVKRFVDLRG
ncbi:phenylacetate--CoA ligase family protein [Muricoccus radiodurans]|uniref:phenylacetate--CoA ligase family protein n=1 Tax=Muricoccus radiodurans TaxID=2231721 RepID=UPI003CEF8197